ncbi:MAG: LLM class flavin-dependent oxidoreductase [Ginsengibacter sp.]
MKKIPISILELATILEGKPIEHTFKNSLELAQKAEQWGYKRFWLAEHHNMVSVASSATSILIGYIAAGTEKIRVGSGGIMLPNHAPLIIAEQFGTLGTLYPNRIDLGLGRAPGTDPLTARALRRDLLQAGNIFPSQVTELLNYLSTENHTSSVRAVPGEGVNVPVWILGSSTDSAYLAAAYGLPYAFASHFAPSQLQIALQIYRQNFKPSVYISEPYTMAAINVVAADTDEKANEISTSFKLLATGIISGNRKPMQPPVKSMDGLWSEYEEAAVGQMMTYSFIGSAATIQPRIHDFIEKTAVDELMIVGHIYEQKARLRSFEIVSTMLSDEK